MQELKDRTYKLVSKNPPLSYILPTRHSRAFPLQYFDEKKQENRALRYATNQKSIFEDEQVGDVVLAPVVFEAGFLYVPKSNITLQVFLDHHPQIGVVFEEVNKAKDAQAELDAMEAEADALIAAKQLDIENLEMVYRAIYNRGTDSISTAELKRDIRVYAKNNPENFLEILQDPDTELESEVQTFLDMGLLSLRKNNREVYFNLPDNKKKMVNIPTGFKPVKVICEYLKSDEGIQALKMLEGIASE